ncbi:hypothetical protein AB751O23_AP_00090 [Chlamydiales bacterium SCGC AB-751-O23]|nr:hypothetical protein AB751O23_AP_00090 [Chlamydiales bacterium SCGC AB-751-O23]
MIQKLHFNNVKLEDSALAFIVFYFLLTLPPPSLDPALTFSL